MPRDSKSRRSERRSGPPERPYDPFANWETEPASPTPPAVDEDAPPPSVDIPRLEWTEPDLERIRQRRSRRDSRLQADRPETLVRRLSGGITGLFARRGSHKQVDDASAVVRRAGIGGVTRDRAGAMRQLRPADRVRLPSMRLPINRVGLYFVASILFVAAIVIGLGRLRNNPIALRPNAIWLGTEWTYDAPTDEAVRAMADRMAQHQIGTLYTWMSWLQADGTWRGEDKFPNVQSFVKQMDAISPDTFLYAWISLPVDVGGYRLDDVDVQQKIADLAQRAVTEFGFNGVFLNVEPVWNNDEAFLALLRKVRLAVGSEVPISAAIPPDWSPLGAGIPVPPLITPGTIWDEEYKQSVALLVDEMAVMAYNSGLSNADDYSTWVAYQVQVYAEALAELGVGTQLVVGIPTYDTELPAHDPAVENVTSAVRGLDMGLVNAGSAASYVRGVALYAGWTTDETEWLDFLRVWSAR